MVRKSWSTLIVAGILAVLAVLTVVQPRLGDSSWIVGGICFVAVMLFNLINIWQTRSFRERTLWVGASCGGILGWAAYLLQTQLSFAANGAVGWLLEGSLAGFGLGLLMGMGRVPADAARTQEPLPMPWPYRAGFGLCLWTFWLLVFMIPAYLEAPVLGISLFAGHILLAVVWLVSFTYLTVKSPAGFWRQSYGLLTAAALFWHLGLVLGKIETRLMPFFCLLALAMVILGVDARSKAKRPTHHKAYVDGGITPVSFWFFWISVFVPVLLFFVLWLFGDPSSEIARARAILIVLHVVVLALATIWVWILNLRRVAFYRRHRQAERESHRKVHELLENQIMETSSRLDQTKSFLDEEMSLRRSLEDSIKKRDQRYQILIETMNEGLGVLTRDMTFSHVNNSLCKMLGYEANEMLGQKLFHFFDEENQAIILAQWEKRSLGIEEPYEVDWLAKGSGKVSTKISPRIIKNEDDQNDGSFAVITDMTERKRVENELRIRLQYDPLTGLVNRTLLMERLDRALLAARRDDQHVAVLILDLDRFKRINDSLGHDMGDGLLVAVAKRLDSIIDEWDTVSRLGADEFALVLTNMSNPMGVVFKVEQIQAIFSKPFSLRGRDVTVSCSIGISIWPSDGHSAQVLMNNADAAMYHAKNMGRNGYQFYTGALNKAAFQRLEIENQLRKAFGRDELVLHYQPKVDIKSGKVVGVEALMRWFHTERGFLSPDLFIPIAEETGLIGRLSDWLLDEACKQVKLWQEVSPQLIVGINVSANQFSSEDLVAKVLSALSKNQLEPESLELEITESLAMENIERSITILEQLKALGVRVSLDDFGTGHASLNYLKRLSFRTLKIDRCFIEHADTDTVDAAIVRAIIEMGHGLGLEVIAEGVETKEQLAFLAEHGCDQIQGYFISKPLAPEKMETLLAKKTLIPE